MQLQSGNILRTSAEEDKKTKAQRGSGDRDPGTEKPQANNRECDPPDLDAEPATRVKRQASLLGRVAGPDTAGVGSSSRVSLHASAQQIKVNQEDPPQPSSFPIAARWVPPDEPPEEVRGTLSLEVYEHIKEYLRDTTDFVDQNISDEYLKQMGYDSWAQYIFLPLCINASGE